MSLETKVNGLGEDVACISEGGFWDGESCLGYGFAQQGDGPMLNGEFGDDVDCEEYPDHELCRGDLGLA